MADKENKDLTLFVAHRDATCDECCDALGQHAWIMLQEDKGVLCLSCKEVDEEAVHLAVVVHVRRAESAYDELLARGYERHEARGEIAADVERVLVRWGEES